MLQVEIFKTNVNSKRAAREAVLNLSHNLPEYKMNFDLDDCDKVLRVRGNTINTERILKSMKQLGYECELIS